MKFGGKQAVNHSPQVQIIIHGSSRNYDLFGTFLQRPVANHKENGDAPKMGQTRQDTGLWSNSDYRGLKPVVEPNGVANESGRPEVYVQVFPGPGGKRQVSTGVGVEPRWRRDDKELFRIAPDGKLMAVPIQAAGQTLEAGAAVSLFQSRIMGGGGYALGPPHYAVAPGGQRFLINTNDESTVSPITIVTNWARALKK